MPKVDSEFEEITEREEEGRKQKLKTKWAELEALVGSEKRIRLIAEDLVQHFERRPEAMDGKAMNVCMSRRICVDLYNELIKLRPDWASAPDDDIEAEKKQSTVVKIVMTGSADDGADWQPHIRSKLRRKALATRFKDTKDPFRIVIVRDMWLAGFVLSRHMLSGVAARRGSATNTPGRVLSGTFESPALALVIADRLVGESMTLGVAHAVGRESCGHHVACRVGGRDRTECSQHIAHPLVQRPDVRAVGRVPIGESSARVRGVLEGSAHSPPSRLANQAENRTREIRQRRHHGSS